MGHGRSKTFELGFKGTFYEFHRPKPKKEEPTKDEGEGEDGACEGFETYHNHGENRMDLLLEF